MAPSFVSGLRPRGHAHSARVWESDGATARAVCRTLGIRSHRCLACMLARVIDGTDFRASRSGGGSEPAAAHSLRECGRAMARRRGQFAGPWVSGHTDACTHIGVGGRSDIFSSIEKRRRECTGCRARFGRVAESDGATAQAVAGPKDFGPLGRCTHIGAGARRDRFSTMDERGRRCLREPAHGLGEWPRAMA